MHSFTDLPFKESSLHKQKRGLQGVNCFQWMETWICSSSWPSLPSSVSSFPHQIHLSFPLLRTRHTVGKRSTFFGHEKYIDVDRIRTSDLSFVSSKSIPKRVWVRFQDFSCPKIWKFYLLCSDFSFFCYLLAIEFQDFWFSGFIITCYNVDFQWFSNPDFMPSKIKAFLLMQIVKNNTLLDLRKEQSLFFKLSANWHVIV